MRFTAAAVILSASFTTPVLAQNTAKPSWYVGAGVGYAKVTERVSEETSLIVPGATASNFTFDGTNTSGKAAVGFNLNRYVALEGSFVHFGKMYGRRDVLAPSAGTVDVNWKVYGLGLAVRAGWPVTDRLTVFGKVGTARLTTDRKSSNTLVPEQVDEKKARWSLMYGAGLDLDLTSNIGLRAEWELYRNGSNTNTINIGGNAIDYNTFFGSVYYRF